jgi:monoamine oxidase
VDIAGASVDLGGAWIHGGSNNPVNAFCGQNGISFRADPQEVELYVVEGSGSVSSGEIGRLDDEYERFHNKLSAIRSGVGGGGGASFSQGVEYYIREWDLTGSHAARTRFMLHQANENDYSGPSDMTSLRWYWEDEDFGGTDHIIDGGYQAFLGALADGVDVTLNQAVRSIEDTGDGVVVTTDDAEYSAGAVIVTIPLGVLQAGVIDFVQPLAAEKDAAISALDMGSLEKVIFRFDSRFWSDEFEAVAMHEAMDGSRRFPVFQDFTSFSGQPTLVAFHGGASARQTLDTLDDEQVVEETLGALRVLLGRTDIPVPQATHVTRWRSDEWSRGSYLYVPVGASRNDICALAAPDWDGRLLFAGEATDPEYFGSVHAAMRSAGREVRRFGIAPSLPCV